MSGIQRLVLADKKGMSEPTDAERREEALENPTAKEERSEMNK